MYAKFAIKFMIILRYLSVFSFLWNGADNLSSVEIFSIPKKGERARAWERKRKKEKWNKISRNFRYVFIFGARYLSSTLFILFSPRKTSRSLNWTKNNILRICTQSNNMFNSNKIVMKPINIIGTWINDGDDTAFYRFNYEIKTRFSFRFLFLHNFSFNNRVKLHTNTNMPKLTY